METAGLGETGTNWDGLEWIWINWERLGRTGMDWDGLGTDWKGPGETGTDWDGLGWTWIDWEELGDWKRVGCRCNVTGLGWHWNGLG